MIRTGGQSTESFENLWLNQFWLALNSFSSTGPLRKVLNPVCFLHPCVIPFPYSSLYHLSSLVTEIILGSRKKNLNHFTFIQLHSNHFYTWKYSKTMFMFVYISRNNKLNESTGKIHNKLPSFVTAKQGFSFFLDFILFASFSWLIQEETLKPLIISIKLGIFLWIFSLFPQFSCVYFKF